jgi:aldose 1-epimerase
VSGPASGEQYELVHGEQRVVVAEVGATLRSYEAGGREVIDGFAIGEHADGGRGQALIPWPNRLGDGRYEWEGETQQLPLDEVALRNAIHGLVRWRNWDLLERDPSRLKLGLRLFPQPGYPFTLALSIAFELGDRGLRVVARAENLGARACPYGVGFHPYVRVGERVDTAVLIVPASAVLALDERQLPVSWGPVAGTDWDFRKPRTIGPLELDTCFGDLTREPDGRARVRISDEEGSVAVWLGEGFDYLMIYTGDTLAPPRRRQGIAVEAMSCAPNAFQSGEGLVRLEPGQAHEAEWGIEP